MKKILISLTIFAVILTGCGGTNSKSKSKTFLKDLYKQAQIDYIDEAANLLRNTTLLSEDESGDLETFKYNFDVTSEDKEAYIDYNGDYFANFNTNISITYKKGELYKVVATTDNLSDFSFTLGLRMLTKMSEFGLSTSEIDTLGEYVHKTNLTKSELKGSTFTVVVGYKEWTFTRN